MNASIYNYWSIHTKFHSQGNDKWDVTVKSYYPECIYILVYNVSWLCYFSYAPDC